ncbi:hypothetical protein Poli38472_002169 [Pythium oligandrum]|uniref:UDP-glucuronate decarboxylase n=1 Tax=Pythium oligandrum TaxID=41045 RepID=A0A8K1CHT0_PYTOL|nr:hypothetical protein Poli38472_002169 [Pythium oligandrum]|eukprot:TMW63228.1 hypothetical protein Poli38472_002169 [Pythium oligandrum]
MRPPREVTEAIAAYVPAHGSRLRPPLGSEKSFIYEWGVRVEFEEDNKTHVAWLCLADAECRRTKQNLYVMSHNRTSRAVKHLRLAHNIVSDKTSAEWGHKRKREDESEPAQLDAQPSERAYQPLPKKPLVDLPQRPTMAAEALTAWNGENEEQRSEVVEAIPRPITPTQEMRRILVAGGAGFIGLHLCKRLLEMGHEVLCLDNLFTSQRVNVLPLIQQYPNFEFIRHDVTEPYSCEVDHIYNLACPASPVHYQYNPIKTTKVSFLGAFNLLGLAKRVKGRIFQASTSEVYGDPEVTPQREDYWGHVNCTGVRACYDEGKRVAETLFFEYHRTHDVDIRVGRIFNTYGPGMHPYDGRVVSNFIMQALRNEDITIYGSGEQTRSFCYIDDLVDGIIRFMDCTTCIGPMNLGNPHEMTVFQLATMIIRLTGSQSKLVLCDLPNNDPRRRKPDISLAQEHLNWTPSVKIEEGLRRTIEYFSTLDLSKYKRPTNHTAHRSSQRLNSQQNGSSKPATTSN